MSLYGVSCQPNYINGLMKISYIRERKIIPVYKRAQEVYLSSSEQKNLNPGLEIGNVLNGKKMNQLLKISYIRERKIIPVHECPRRLFV